MNVFSPSFFLLSLLILTPLSFLTLPFTIKLCGRAIGWYIRSRTSSRRELLLSRAEAEEKEYHAKSPPNGDEEWERVESYTAGSDTNGEKGSKAWSGVIGFFHPFCNAGGGGERVLWAAIRATQRRWPEVLCIVYTGDHDVDKNQIIDRVRTRFNIHLHPPKIQFLYLSTRRFVLASTWPHFTLLGQSFGSLVLAYDAFNLLVPDVFVDTMGYAFTLGFSKFLFPDVPTGAYVHYPTISTDMLGSLDEGGHGVNAGQGRGYRGVAKRQYWLAFAWLYSFVGGQVDVVMTNSTWTQGHIRKLWGPRRARRKKVFETEAVFPPVAVEELEGAIDVSKESEKNRGKYLLYIAQFRPEKNHQVILDAFAKFLHVQQGSSQEKPKLILIGSVRDSDDATRVYKLRLLAHELKIKDDVEFICDASWPQILDWLRRSWVGVNGMWNEHFGIGVVEYQAAGLISVVNASGGPKIDIVVDVDGQPTGFHATTPEEFAHRFGKALSLSSDETLAMRLRARASAKRFTEDAIVIRP
ncbi:glycosyltransferase family 4 protein [Viridothelium virens]|uniref:GDP-Man:Man(3)GlcNAc(2)-PP-Dol alpha-1,2-mannosyltransferase n=1 Tax=Viridothelium virens TaxID=1048519 RepID=A0A6A6GUJ2_VIRVR|nr:glycosyltransferase family 4 protein [Viridothelium virens]